MTVEVAILNRSAVAIAADSAMTTGLPGQEKTFLGANKIFTLSKYHPVGIMIYGGADFLGVPWETVIKSYRHKIGRKSFSTIKEVSDDFIEYINDQQYLTKREQQSFVYLSVMGAIGTLATRIKDENLKKIDAPTVKAWLKEIQEGCKDDLCENDKVTAISYQQFHSLYGASIEEFLDCDEVRPFNIQKSCYPAFKKCTYEFLRSEHTTNLSSGIVIVGFGEEEMFPSLCKFSVDGGVYDQVRIVPSEGINIGREGQNVAIESFAQDAPINSFVHGYESAYRRTTLKNLRGFLDAYVDDVLENHTNYDEDGKKVVRAMQRSGTADAVKKFGEELDKYAFNRYTSPVRGVLANATKDEMCDFAEALVNLTSMRQRVSMARESVAGDVDVAVISKGDGFVWIKRKHYFDRNINHHYFKNYFGGTDE